MKEQSFFQIFFKGSAFLRNTAKMIVIVAAVFVFGSQVFFGYVQTVRASDPITDCQTKNTADCYVRAGLKATGDKAGYEPQSGVPQRSVEELVGTIIKFILGFLLSFFFILTLYGGYLWMSARGNEEQVKKARTIIEQAIIGMAIVMLSYLITYIVSEVIIGGTGYKK